MALQLDIRTPHGGIVTMTLEDGDADVGRAAGCEIRLPYPTVSSRHIRLAGDGRSWRLIDLGSTNGTWLNGERVRTCGEVPLTDDAQIEIAGVSIQATIVTDTGEGFTLEESGTMLRQLIAESTSEADGAACVREDGTRVEIPDSATNLRLGDEGGRFRIDRRGHGFWLTPIDPTHVGGARLEAEGCLLSNGLTFETDRRWTFEDPLEPLVDAIVEPAAAPNRRSRTNVDLLMVVIGASAVVLSAAGLLWIFEVF